MFFTANLPLYLLPLIITYSSSSPLPFPLSRCFGFRREGCESLVIFMAGVLANRINNTGGRKRNGKEVEKLFVVVGKKLDSICVLYSVTIFPRV